MTNKSGAIGTWTTTSVILYLKSNGWPSAELRNLAGQYDKGDIVGTPGLVWESKGGKAAEGASDAQVVDWLGEAEVERRNANAAYGILTMKKKGVGRDNAARWTAVMWSDAFAHMLTGSSGVGPPFPVRMTLGALVSALRAAGWGDEL